jgi:hypothetical protein
VGERHIVKVTYDPKADTLIVVLKDNVTVVESDEEPPAPSSTTTRVIWSPRRSWPGPRPR